MIQPFGNSTVLPLLKDAAKSFMNSILLLQLFCIILQGISVFFLLTGMYLYDSSNI